MNIIMSGYNRPTFNISREGNTVTASEDNGGRRCMGESYTVTLDGENVQIRGPYGKEKDFDIKLRPDGADVATPDNGMRRGWGDGFTLAFDKPVTPDQYDRVGLSIASSIIGIPLCV